MLATCWQLNTKLQISLFVNEFTKLVLFWIDWSGKNETWILWSRNSAYLHFFPFLTWVILFSQLEAEKERLSGEMSEIHGTIKSENHVLKVIESQNRNRTYRANTELCQDDSTDNLSIQIFNLRNVIEKLNNQLERVKYVGWDLEHVYKHFILRIKTFCYRKTYDTICEQIQTTEEESKAKTWALNIDNRCLEIRSDPTM